MQNDNTFQPNNTPEPTPPTPQDSLASNQFGTQSDMGNPAPSSSFNAFSNTTPTPNPSPLSETSFPSSSPLGSPVSEPSSTFEPTLVQPAETLSVNNPAPAPAPAESVTTSFQPYTPPVAQPVQQPAPAPAQPVNSVPSLPPAQEPVAPMYGGASIVESPLDTPFVAKKSKKKLVIILVLLLPLLLGAGGLGYYYLMVRTPNSAYSEAAEQVETMLASAKTVSTNKLKLPLLNDGTSSSSGEASSASTDSAKLAEQTLASVNTYKSALAKLKSLEIVKNDKDVESALNSNISAFEKYSTDYPDLIKTSSTIASLTTICGASLSQTATAKSLVEFDTVTKPCSTYMQQNPTLPNATLSAQYSGILVVIQQVFDASKGALQLALSGKLADAQKAKASADAAVRQLQQVQASLAQYKLDTPADPSKQLESLKKTITDRENVFFR